MVREIRVYVEGGAEGRGPRTEYRRGFHEFLREVVAEARKRGVRFKIIACGPRDDAYESFVTAQSTNPDALNLLLVDSEGPVASPPWEYLRRRDGWDDQHAGEMSCHLMVQQMEAWFVADRTALARFYGNGFREGALPAPQGVEQIDRGRLEPALRAATRETTKGEYHKTWHAPDILAELSAQTVRQAAPHCDRLFRALLDAMNLSA